MIKKLRTAITHFVLVLLIVGSYPSTAKNKKYPRQQLPAPEIATTSPLVVFKRMRCELDGYPFYAPVDEAYYLRGTVVNRSEERVEKREQIKLWDSDGDPVAQELLYYRLEGKSSLNYNRKSDGCYWAESASIEPLPDS